MRHRRLTLIAAAVTAALAAALGAVAIGAGSSHREAPLTSLDPTADNTDVYAYVANDAQDAVTLVANWVPFEDPAGGPNFYRFDDRAHYYINVDNTGDGKPDIRYLFQFTTRTIDPNSFLYAKPTVDSIDSPNLNVQQSYSVTKETWNGDKMRSSNVVANDVPVAPNNVGPKTMPNYGALADQAIKPVQGGGKVFAGQRDDPFFVDLGATFDALTIRNGTGNAGGGKDDLAGYNIHSIVLQVPKSQVSKDGKGVSGPSDSNAVVGVWSSTDRQRLQASGAAVAKAGKGVKNHKGHKGRKAQSDDASKGNKHDFIQVSRLGNPLINEVVIPLGLKDQFNATQPADDAKNYGKFVLNPELARLINVLYPGLNVPETDRTDIVQALLTGLPGKTQIAPNPAAADTLKLNLGVPPAQNASRFGVLGGDLAGFPDGRRLGDDVVDIEERVVAGALKGNDVPLGDGVDQNDKPFLTAFPYLAPPTAGLDSQPKRNEPTHDPVPAPVPSGS
jgi:hypothetical protein